MDIKAETEENSEKVVESIETEKQTQEKEKKTSQQLLSEQLIISQGHKERKINIFHTLQKWQENKTYVLSNLRNFLEMIQGKVDYIVIQSQQTIQLLVVYFQGRCEQEMKYQSLQLPSIDILQQMNSHKKNQSDQILISTILDIEKMQDSKLKKQLNLAKIIKDIILKNLKKSYEGYYEITERLKQGIIETKQKLIQLDNIVSNSQHSFQQAFDNLDTHQIKSDFLTEAQTFLRYNIQHSESHRTLSMETFNFWQEVNHLENQRKIILKKQLQVYLQGEQEIGNSDQTRQRLLDDLLSKFQDPQEDEIILANGLEITDVFTVQQLQAIAQLFKELPENYNEWTFQMIKRQFENFDVKQQIDIDQRLLTLKKFKCQQLVQQGANDFLVECRLFITVDLFIISFNYSCGYFLSKPNFCIDLRSCKIQVLDPLAVEIKEIKPGFFMNKEIPYLIKFTNIDYVEELIEFIQTLNIK